MVNFRSSFKLKFTIHHGLPQQVRHCKRHTINLFAHTYKADLQTYCYICCKLAKLAQPMAIRSTCIPGLRLHGCYKDS